MPAYDYQCNSCKAVYELRQGFDAPTKHKCEQCGKGTAKRVLSTPAVVFKGSGWYATDSRNSKTAVTDSTSPASGEAAAATTDAKPAATEAKTESKPAATETAAGG